MKILITGGAGFIGSNLANELAKKHDVIVVDNEFLGTRTNLIEGIEFIKMDVGDKENLKKLFKKEGFDYAHHLAAISSAPMYLDGKASDPRQWLRINVEGFTNVMQLCMENNVKKMIYASTSSMYSGNPLPYSEGQVIIPKTFYETTLYCRELMADTYRRMHGFKSVGIRYFAVYGYNELHKGKYANLVSQFLWAMLADKSPIIYGDGKQTRDFTFVTDIIKANILAMETDMDGVFNAGTGVSCDLNQLVEEINRQLGTNIKPKYIVNPLKNYVSNTLADIQKIEKFGYKPDINLSEGIKKLIEYYKNKG